MRTKNFLFSLLLVGAAGVMSAQAQEPKKKLAVLVVGMGSAAKSNDFAARLGSDLNRDNEYELVTNSAVADKLAALRDAHTAGTPADTTGLAAWGKANGIDLVQLVVESTIAGTPIVSGQISRVAHLVDCETGMLSGRGLYRMSYATKEMEASSGLAMVRVTGGTFEMGYKSSRDGASISDALPLHTVTVDGFSIGRYPVTQAQWEYVMGSLPTLLTSTYSSYVGKNKPMICVSHDEIVTKGTGFLDKLNALTGKNYRLPTEAEWEYAARGCSGSPESCESVEYSGDKTIENVAYYGKSSGGPTTVGTLSPNKLGIYDMSGNVWEWCFDYYSASFYTTANNPLDNPVNTTTSSSRVLRGGSWFYTASASRVVCRGSTAPSDRGPYYGFRLVLP